MSKSEAIISKLIASPANIDVSKEVFAANGGVIVGTLFVPEHEETMSWISLSTVAILTPFLKASTTIFVAKFPWVYDLNCIRPFSGFIVAASLFGLKAASGVGLSCENPGSNKIGRASC